MNETTSIIPRMAVLVAGLAAAAITGAQPAVTPTIPVAAASGSGPRIGLALSGGGARGLAHVGVLKVLEELRVPIHCVTGTSMGAIVGGTFAAGRPPAEMEKIVLAADWDEIFRDRPPREEIAVRRKVDDYKTLFAPEFGVKDGGLALPKGVIAGVSIESFFRSLATPAFGITDFTKLPIPFRAMGTDIETGESVVLDHGSLAQAMRASMSVPGALSPVEIDGRLLVDGGIANNLPIDEARKLCADVIIAVNISTPPMKRKDITSALSVTGAAGQLPRQADRRRAVEEPGREGRADRAGPRRHLGGHVRSLRRGDRDRREGDARAGRQAQRATACRRSSTPRCARRRSPR